jgi:glutaredoxin-like protein DUF836
MSTVPTLTVLSRPYCHLCDEMLAALEPIAKRCGARMVVEDVDADAELTQRYGDLVPVLLLGTARTGVPLCHYRLDEDALLRALAAR